MTRSKRGFSTESETPFAAAAQERGAKAVWAYWISVYGLIPLLGAILGPVAVWMGIRARILERNEKGNKGKATANAAILLGTAEWLTTWAGIYFIYQGIRSL